MTHLLERADTVEKSIERASGDPSLWPELIDKIGYKIIDAAYGNDIFEGVDRKYRLAYVEALTRQTDSQGNPTLWAGTAMTGLLSESARGTSLFEGISDEERLRYIKNVTEQMDLGGNSTDAAEKAKTVLLEDVYGNRKFKGITLEERLAFFEDVASQKGDTRASKENVKSARGYIDDMISNLIQGNDFFYELPKKTRAAFLMKIASQRNPDGTVGSTAEKALNAIFDDLQFKSKRNHLGVLEVSDEFSFCDALTELRDFDDTLSYRVERLSPIAERARLHVILYLNHLASIKPLPKELSDRYFRYAEAFMEQKDKKGNPTKIAKEVWTKVYDFLWVRAVFFQDATVEEAKSYLEKVSRYTNLDLTPDFRAEDALYMLKHIDEQYKKLDSKPQ